MPILPSGVLPVHYTTMLLRQLRHHNEAMRDFFDLFNHRLISMLYRAIEKHHFPLAFERTRHNGRADADGLTQILFALIGMGADDLRGRMSVRDENLLYFAGHFSRSPRSAVALERIISEYFRVECRVIQFQGQWLRLNRSDQSAMPGPAEAGNAKLGINTILGREVWDVQSRFLVQLGPLDLERFIDFTPSRPMLRELCELIRLYVGMEYDFDVQPILRREDVPISEVGGDAESGAHLGWTSWLRTDAATEDFSGAVFSLDDV
jgi:type VI secretion system protein ImpH